MQRRQVTLKEKLSDHYMRRDFKPDKASASTVGMSVFIGMLITLFIEGLLLLLPSYFTDEEGNYKSGYRVAQLVALWLFAESGINWYLTYYDVDNRVMKETKDVHHPNTIDTPPGWKRCMTCMIDVPPRSHHCTLCNYCILKRDHHCFFTGSCIGYYNQSTFLIFCIYTSLACSYAAYMQFMYLNQDFPIFTNAAIFYFPVVTIWQVLTGTASFASFFVLIHLYVTLICLGFCLFFIGWQFLVIARGQTSYEAWKQIMIYRRRSTLANFYSVFGNPIYVLLRFFIPIKLKLPEDGIKWTIEAKAEKGH